MFSCIWSNSEMWLQIVWHIFKSLGSHILFVLLGCYFSFTEFRMMHKQAVLNSNLYRMWDDNTNLNKNQANCRLHYWPVFCLIVSIWCFPLFVFSARSPVFSHLSATLQGLHTIRAFNVESKFVEEFDNHQDLHTEAWFLFLTSSRWLATRLDWLCALFVSSVSFFSVMAADSELTVFSLA